MERIKDRMAVHKGTVIVTPARRVVDTTSVRSFAVSRKATSLRNWTATRRSAVRSGRWRTMSAEGRRRTTDTVRDASYVSSVFNRALS